MHIGLNGDGDDLNASRPAKKNKNFDCHIILCGDLMVPQTKNRRPFVFCNFFFLHRAITCIESQDDSFYTTT
ncbi:hypothetical protein BCR42DRAFT_426345 [Absidia repens]|nr:hypothetical protein BCR42DRAFT_426345 [Absidia repens]